ncbi:MAG: hypothetical protein IJM30_12165 [Thermoguttaceae bacterium]|nr:hypothetical protein [Thermoguttaceae bacterium]
MATFTNARKRALRDKALDEAARAVDQNRRIRLASEQGLEQGRKEGERKKEESIIRNMLQMGGFTLDKIATIVGAPVSQVEALANGANLA